MQERLERPALISKAARRQKGGHWAAELLIFVTVYMLCFFGQMLVLLPGELLMLSRHDGYKEAAAAGDAETVMEISGAIAASDGYAVLRLFSSAAIIIVAILFCRMFQKRDLFMMGYVREGAPRRFAIGAGLGFLLYSAAALSAIALGGLRLEGVSETFSIGMLILYLAGCIVQGIAEETLFRGYLLVSIARRYPTEVAVFFSTAAFVVLHAANSGLSVLAIINLALYGILASLYFLETESVWGVAAFHALWNFASGSFYGIRFEGKQMACSVLALSQRAGRELFSGGAAGLQGSVCVTAAYAVGIAALLFYGQKKKKNAAHADSDAAIPQDAGIPQEIPQDAGEGREDAGIPQGIPQMNGGE